MKKLVLFAAAFAAIFVFCGCGNSSKDNSAAEIKECAKNMRRLAKTIDRYRKKHGRLQYSWEKSLKNSMETDVTFECPISQKPYKYEYENAIAQATVMLECKHKDKTLHANLYGRVDAIPNDDRLNLGSKMPYGEKHMIFNEF